MPRTDNDTWNLATSVGATATMVAAARAIATKADNPIIEDRFAEPLVNAVGVDFFTRWAAGELDAADVDYDESTWKLEHMPDAMAARTRFFDNFFRDATQAGIRQAVILASGLDARAYRLAWPADMTVFEIDQPEVIEFKAVTLEGLGATPADRPAHGRHRSAAGLAHGAASRLASTRVGRQRGSPRGSSVICRRKPRIACWTTSLRSAATGSRLACEAVPNRPEVDKDRVRELMQRASAKWREHGLDLDFSELGFEGDRNDVATYLENLGWRTTGTPMHQLLADNGLAAIPQNDGAVSVADTVYYSSVLTTK